MTTRQQYLPKTTTKDKIITGIGTLLCIILVPILLMNLILLIRSYTNTAEVPTVGGFSPMIVLTESMNPDIKSGDLVLCRRVNAADIKEGDIISFFDPDSTGNSVVTHRVTEVIDQDGNLSFRTKGDANDSEDQTLVPAQNLVGRYQTKISGAGNVAMFMQTTTGLILCVFVPMLLMVGYDVIRHRIYEKNKEQDTDALLAELESLKAQKRGIMPQQVRARPYVDFLEADSYESYGKQDDYDDYDDYNDYDDYDVTPYDEKEDDFRMSIQSVAKKKNEHSDAFSMFDKFEDFDDL